MAMYDIILVTGNTGSTTTQVPVYVSGTTTGVSGETIITGETIISAVTTTFVFSGLTSSDGDMVTEGILKFESKFAIGVTRVLITPKFYRSRPKFELGYKDVEMLNYPKEFYLNFTADEFYQITPGILFTKVCEYLNEILHVVAFEIIQY